MVDRQIHGRHLALILLAIQAAPLASTAVFGSSRADAADAPKLNLLFIQTDEQRADTMAAYGNTKIRTSNLDRLAREKLLAQGFDGQPLRTESDWRRLIARYWGLVTQVDRSVGGILDRLDRLGLAERTIVVYTSDHGDMMGSSGRIRYGGPSFHRTGGNSRCGRSASASSTIWPTTLGNAPICIIPADTVTWSGD